MGGRACKLAAAPNQKHLYLEISADKKRAAILSWGFSSVLEEGGAGSGVLLSSLVFILKT